MNKNKSLVIVNIILMILALTFGGYIVYDKMIATTQTEEIKKQEITKEEVETQNKVGSVGTISNEIISDGTYSLYIDEKGDVFAYNLLNTSTINLTENIDAKAISIIQNTDVNAGIRIIALMEDGTVYMNKYSGRSVFDETFDSWLVEKFELFKIETNEKIIGIKNIYSDNDNDSGLVFYTNENEVRYLNYECSGDYDVIVNAAKLVSDINEKRYCMPK